MMWNRFSSKGSAAALLATPDLGLSNTHFSQEQAGQTFRQALQRMHRDQFLLPERQPLLRRLGFQFAYLRKPVPSGCFFPCSPRSSSKRTIFLLLQTLQRSRSKFFRATSSMP